MDTDSNSKTVMKNKKMRNSTQRMSFLYKKMFKEGFFAHTQSCHEKKKKKKKKQKKKQSLVLPFKSLLPTEISEIFNEQISSKRQKILYYNKSIFSLQQLYQRIL